MFPDVHNVVDPPQLFGTSVGGFPETLNLCCPGQRSTRQGLSCGGYLAHITSSDTNDLCSWPYRCNVLCRCLGLLYASSDDARVRAQSNEGPCLHTTDISCTTSHEDHSIVCSAPYISQRGPRSASGAAPGPAHRRFHPSTRDSGIPTREPTCCRAL